MRLRIASSLMYYRKCTATLPSENCHTQLLFAHEAIYERFFTVLRHIIWQERQEMRQNCGYPLHELHFAVHRKDGSIGATIGKRDARSSRSWSSQGTSAYTHAMQEDDCFCHHSSLLLGLDY